MCGVQPGMGEDAKEGCIDGGSHSEQVFRVYRGLNVLLISYPIIPYVGITLIVTEQVYWLNPRSLRVHLCLTKYTFPKLSNVLFTNVNETNENQVCVHQALFIHILRKC